MKPLYLPVAATPRGSPTAKYQAFLIISPRSPLLSPAYPCRPAGISAPTKKGRVFLRTQSYCVVSCGGEKREEAHLLLYHFASSAVLRHAQRAAQTPRLLFRPAGSL